MGFPGGSDSKESASHAGERGSVPGLGRYTGEGNGSPLECSCLENSKDRGILSLRKLSPSPVFSRLAPFL